MFQPDARAVTAARLLRVAGAGVLLTGSGMPDSVALASDAAVHRLCTLEADGVPGPAAASLGNGDSLHYVGPDGDGAPESAYAEALHSAGFAAAIAIPVGHGSRVPGVLLLCQKRAIRLTPRQSQLAQILATILVETAVRGQAMRRLQAAIDSVGTALRRIDQEVLADADGIRK
jgi:hypothetical protein